MAGKYVGFGALKAKIEAKGKSPANAAAIASMVGRRKYGAKAMASHAAKGDPFGKIGSLTAGQRIERGRDGRPHEGDPGFDPKTMGNRRSGRSR